MYFTKEITNAFNVLNYIFYNFLRAYIVNDYNEN